MLFSRCVFCEKKWPNYQRRIRNVPEYAQTHTHVGTKQTNIYRNKSHKYISEQNKQIYIGTNHTNIYQNKQIYIGTKHRNIYRNNSNKYILEQNEQIYIGTKQTKQISNVGNSLSQCTVK